MVKLRGKKKSNIGLFLVRKFIVFYKSYKIELLL